MSSDTFDSLDNAYICISSDTFDIQDPQVVTGSHDTTIKFWDLRNGNITLFAIPFPVSYIC